jgi:hypothetical protein
VPKSLRARYKQLNLEPENNLKTTSLALAVLLILFLTTAAVCVAQSAPETPTASPQTAPEQAPPPAKPSAGQASQTTDPNQSKDKSKDDKSKEKDSDTSGTSKDRLFYALPNFLSVEQKGEKIAPLTTKQKYAVVARGSFDPVQIVWYGFLSGISQAENSEPGFGQGAEGYFKRYGAYAADGTIENFFTGAILPSMLHQDPRFFPSGEGSFFHRTGYAVSRIVVTRTDSGHSQFNYSEVFGSAIASAISTYSYHPRRTFLGIRNGQPDYAASDRTLKNTASVWGTQVGYDTITIVVKEFWPDIRRKMTKHSSNK